MGEFLTLNDEPGTEGSPWSEQDLARFRQEFAVQRQRQVMIAVPLAGALLFVLVVLKADTTRVLGPRSLWLGLLAVLLIGLWVVGWWTVRCPACGAGWVERRYRVKNHCSSCGVQLRAGRNPMNWW